MYMYIFIYCCLPKDRKGSYHIALFCWDFTFVCFQGYTYTYTDTRVYMWIYIYIHLYIYKYTYIYIFAYVFTHIYIFIYVHIHILHMLIIAATQADDDLGHAGALKKTEQISQDLAGLKQWQSGVVCCFLWWSLSFVVVYWY